MNWPIGSGKNFKGVYDRNTKKVLVFSDTQKGTKEGKEEEIAVDDPHLLDVVSQEQKEDTAGRDRAAGRGVGGI